MTHQVPEPRYDPMELRRFAGALLIAGGLAADKAAAMAEILVETDMMGHTTHGLALLPRYLDEIAEGRMARDGQAVVISDRGSCVCWDGQRLPGFWLMLQAIELGIDRVAAHGIAAIAIGNSHHIGCLAAYLPRVTERGLAITIASSAPGVATVAPFGAISPALSPAPVAVGYPTDGDPVLIDISASITTNNMANQLLNEEKRFPREWVQDADGVPSDDPQVLANGGSLFPAGGLDHGQKGYGWALIGEGLSQGFSGRGRSDGEIGMLNAAFVQIIDPEAFAGLEAFTRQTGAIAGGCRRTRPRQSDAPVRLPGQKALRLRAEAIESGVTLCPGVMDKLRTRAESLHEPVPSPCQS